MITKLQLNKYLGKKIRLTLCSGLIIKGYLRAALINDYFIKDEYTNKEHIFKISYVRRVETC